MRTHLRFALGIAALTTASSSLAAPIAPRPPIAQGSAPIPPGSRCTVEALNVGGIVRPDGSMFVPNVPSNQGQVRLRAACTDPFGAVSQGQSAPVTPIPGSAVSAGGVDFGATTPIAARLTILPAAASLTGIGVTQQLSVGSVFADQTSGDVTAAAAGTVYRSSNPAVVSVSADGLLTAVGLGTAIVSAQNEGALGFATVSVRSAPLVSLDVTPPSISLSVNPAYRQPAAQLAVQGVLATGEVMPLGSAASGVEYSSSDPTVAVVGADGAVFATGAGSTTITVTEPTGVSTQVPVIVTSFSPSPVAAHDTPGFARNVDVRGSLAFVADSSAGLRILDVWSGATVGAMPFAGSSAVDVRLRDTLAVVGLSSGAIALVDVSTPAQPKFLSQLAVSGTVQNVWISGTRAYVATTTQLSVVDLSDPAAPSLVGSQALGAAVNAVAADSARDVIVAVTAQPAVVVVRTEGATPWPTATLPLPAATDQASDVVLLGTSAYVANGRDGLRLVDVSDPAQPALRAASTLNFNALGVALRRTARGTVIAAADNLFVNAVPLFEPGLGNTWNVDFSGFPGAVLSDANGTGVALGDGFGVVTVGDAGIQVFRLEEPVDNAGVPPAVSLAQPADDFRVQSGSIMPLSATAIDDIGVASVELMVDGAVVAADTTLPYSAPLVAGAACSEPTIEARAIDWGGNEALSLPVTLRVKCEAGQPCAEDQDCVSRACSAGICEDGLLSSCEDGLAGKVACWPLDEVSGSSSAELVSGMDASWSGGPTPIAGVHGGALHFDGQNDYLSVASAPPLDFGMGDFSVSFYMRTASTGLHVILDKRVEASGPVRGWVIFISSGRIGVQIADGVHSNFTSNAFVADGQWHHVVISVDRDSPSGLSVYLDKSLVNLFNPTGRQGSLSNVIPMAVGRRSDSSSAGWFSGDLDDLKLFGRVVSASELYEL